MDCLLSLHVGVSGGEDRRVGAQGSVGSEYNLVSGKKEESVSEG